MIIVVGSEKGGVGKTSVAFNLAAYLGERQKVLLIDTDPQLSAANLEALRAQNGHPTKFDVVEKTASHAAGTLAIEMSKNYDAVIIDVGARDVPTLVALSKVADLWLAPTGVGQTDVFSSVELAQAFATANAQHKNGKIPLAMFVNQAPTSSKSEGETCRDALTEALPQTKVLKTILHGRKVWRDASRQGLSIFEMPQRDREKACDEFALLVQEALRFVNKLNK